ncbi:MAG: protein phosphatase CheZ [Gammaproteobacteria bacterium]
MTAVISNNNEALLGCAENLVDRIEEGNETEITRIISQLGEIQEKAMFQEIGKITRKLHDALGGGSTDSRMISIAQSDIPDAKMRLNHVISMTEESANKTLTAIEAALPVSDLLHENSEKLYAKWQKFRSKDMSFDEFRSMSGEIDTFLGETCGQAKTINSKLTDVMMAQDFQDLTGQIIRRVISLVQEVEENLVDMIKSPIDSSEPVNDKKADADKLQAGMGPAVPNVAEAGVAVSGQDEVDDLLSSLGF